MTTAKSPARAKRTATAALTETKRAKFLAHLALTGNVAASARLIKVPTATLYRARQKLKTFADGWAEALNEALDGLEAALLDRAVNGVEKPVFYGGEQKGVIRTYSDQAAMFLLKAHRPELFGRSAEAAPGATSESIADAQAELVRRLDAMAERLSHDDG